MRASSLLFASLFVLGCSSGNGDDGSSNADSGGDIGSATDSGATTDSTSEGDTGSSSDADAKSDSGTTTDGTSSGDSGPIDPTCHALSVAECAAWHTCVPKGFHDSFADDETACVAVVDARDCEGRIPLPRTGDLTAARTACITALGGADACIDFLRQGETGPCYIRGTGLADSCQDGTQCASGACERAGSPSSPPPACGSCAPDSPAGGTCGFGIGCAEGSGCVNTGGSSYTCIAFVDDGASCASAPCWADDKCSGGTCVPRGDVGDACTANGECLFGEFCGKTDHVCHAGVGIAKAGEDCGIYAGLGVVYCAPPLRCLPGAVAGVGKCGDALKEGDACTVVSDNPCEGTLRCESGKCAPQDTCAGDAGP